jgi:hypothetical protein
MPLGDPWAVERVVLAEMFGWTLAQCDELSMEDLIGVRAVLNARVKWKAEQRA